MAAPEVHVDHVTDWPIPDVFTYFPGTFLYHKNIEPGLFRVWTHVEGGGDEHGAVYMYDFEYDTATGEQTTASRVEVLPPLEDADPAMLHDNGSDVLTIWHRSNGGGADLEARCVLYDGTLLTLQAAGDGYWYIPFDDGSYGVITYIESDDLRGRTWDVITGAMGSPNIYEPSDVDGNGGIDFDGNGFLPNPFGRMTVSRAGPGGIGGTGQGVLYCDYGFGSEPNIRVRAVVQVDGSMTFSDATTLNGSYGDGSDWGPNGTRPWDTYSRVTYWNDGQGLDDGFYLITPTGLGLVAEEVTNVTGGPTGVNALPLGITYLIPDAAGRTIPVVPDGGHKFMLVDDDLVAIKGWTNGVAGADEGGDVTLTFIVGMDSTPAFLGVWNPSLVGIWGAVAAARPPWLSINGLGYITP